MAKMRSIALQCCSCVITGLFVRPSLGSESTPLPLPDAVQEPLSMELGGWKVAIALGCIFGLILIIRWAMKRSNRTIGGSGSKGSSIEIIERKSLGPRQSLLLVRVKQKGVLLHQSKSNLVPLCEVDIGKGSQEC
jgi:flagellar biogenesis protein FliO